jgi:hypothetical protein
MSAPKFTTSRAVITFLPWNDVSTFQQIYERDDVVYERVVRNEREVGNVRVVGNEREVKKRTRSRPWHLVLSFDFWLEGSDLTIRKRMSGLTADDDWRLTCQFWRHKSLVLEGTKALSLWHQNVVELSSASWINSITNLLNEHYLNSRLIREENLQKPQSGKKL